MDIDIFDVQAATIKQVTKAITKTKMEKSANGQYTHDTILVFKKQMTRILAYQFYASANGDGMACLLSRTARIKLTDFAICNFILAKSKESAAK